MAVATEPSLWDDVLGSNADVNTLPTSSSAGEASMEDLFPAITQVPLESGGVAPTRKDFNALFNLIGAEVYFKMHGGQFTYSATYDYAVGNMVFYSGLLYMCVQANGASTTVVTPGADSTYWQAVLLGGDGAQTGDVIYTFDLQSGLDRGYLWMNGGLISRTDYADLWQWANDLSLVRATETIADLDASTELSFGPGDGSTTFSLPDMTGRVLTGTNGTDLAKYTPAQLPNIKGAMAIDKAFFTLGTGALTAGTYGQVSAEGTTLNGNFEMTFNASTSNSYYVDSAVPRVRNVPIYALIKA